MGLGRGSRKDILVLMPGMDAWDECLVLTLTLIDSILSGWG